MTTPASPSVALSAARQAQTAFRRHFAWCQAAAYARPCRECRRLELTVSAAYYRADAESERMRALDAAREECIPW